MKARRNRDEDGFAIRLASSRASTGKMSDLVCGFVAESDLERKLVAHADLPILARIAAVRG